MKNEEDRVLWDGYHINFNEATLESILMWQYNEVLQWIKHDVAVVIEHVTLWLSIHNYTWTSKANVHTYGSFFFLM